MFSVLSAIFVLVVYLHLMVDADIYMHHPRGSNNRLNERSANRRNANRVFDSQNNNRGGYNVGDKTDQAAGTDYNKQYHMTHFMSSPDYKVRAGKTSSLLTIEWTNQHGCGGNEDYDPHKLNCQIILQYMCLPDSKEIRDGVTTNTQDYKKGSSKEKSQDFLKRKAGSVKDDRALHESFEWYDKCYQRDRNKGLFTADQRLRGVSSIYTRQNPNGNRRGYECPEERDYYPYWHPTDWKDMAVLAENKTMCSQHYQKHSFNVATKWECVEKYPGTNTYRHWSKYNNKKDCDAAKGEWLEFSNYLEKAKKYKSEKACIAASSNKINMIWARPHGSVNKECLVSLDKPDCIQAPWSRDNHLGNGKEGEALNYTWSIPYFPSVQKQRCVIRIRYNITTDDYDPYYTDSKQNQDLKRGKFSPVQQNPAIDVGADNQPLRLAVNTAQYGRTFQDRSHYFYIEERPGGVPGRKIHNLNVRGKRGNIVQVYPAVEYDFFPTNLNIKAGDLVHIQWTGSNTHNNQAPGGDGQTGDAGEGRGGTDRSNMVQINDPNHNYPVPFEDPDNMFATAKVHWAASGTTLKPMDVILQMASAGYNACLDGCDTSVKKKKMDKLLNNAPASYPGVLIEFRKGTYHYMCSRNNNFSNRSQKGKLIVS